jgi:hypothetical protein
VLLQRAAAENWAMKTSPDSVIQHVCEKFTNRDCEKMS